jgi:hypothetical protein
VAVVKQVEQVLKSVVLVAVRNIQQSQLVQQAKAIPVDEEVPERSVAQRTGGQAVAVAPDLLEAMDQSAGLVEMVEQVLSGFQHLRQQLQPR